METSKYSSQAKHIKENYAKFCMNLKPDMLGLFKQKCKERGTTPTTEIKKFINDFCNEDTP